MTIPNNLPVSDNGQEIYKILYRHNFDDLAIYFQEYNAETSRKCCIVSDSHVASLYMEDVNTMASEYFNKVTQYVFPEGEASKNLNTVHDLYVELIENHFDRNDLLIALGGGVVGDLCGFSAATYLRGIKFIQIPTSLLADVDSSIGGKTGVDFDAYKNMVGAFHMPCQVYINTNTLTTLDERQYYAGMGEVLKSALIKDADLFTYLLNNKELIQAKDTEAIQTMIYRSDLVKKNVVEFDPKETKGERAKLNFGHTLGHAIEKYMNFKCLHGECVSIGSAIASIISFNKGYLSQDACNSICKYIGEFMQVPKLPEDIDIDGIINLTKNDKKADGKLLKFILLNEIGDAIIDTSVNDSDMKKAFETYMKDWNK